MDIVYLLDLIGTMVFAISGTQTAAAKKLDIFGAFLVGTVTAVGSGTIRDILIGNTPVMWLRDINYLYMICLGVLITFAFFEQVSKLRKALFFFDSVGIGIFTIIGLEHGLNAHIPIPLGILVGICTATGGGVIRDVLCNEIPLIFHREIYATACISGAVVNVILLNFDLHHNFITILTVLIVISIRMLSVRFNLSLPRFKPN